MLVQVVLNKCFFFKFCVFLQAVVVAFKRLQLPVHYRSTRQTNTFIKQEKDSANTGLRLCEFVCLCFCIFVCFCVCVVDQLLVGHRFTARQVLTTYALYLFTFENA